MVHICTHKDKPFWNFFTMKFKEFFKYNLYDWEQEVNDLFEHYKNYMKKRYTASRDQVRGFACKGVPWFNRKGVRDHWSVYSPFHINYASGWNVSQEGKSITELILRVVKFMSGT